MKKSKSCGCKKTSDVRKKVLMTKECFESELNSLSAFGSHKFQQNKPFKVTFNEDINVSLGKSYLTEKEKPKKLTKRDEMQKEKMVKKLKEKGSMAKLKKKYGNRAKAVAYAIATKHAKKTP